MKSFVAVLIAALLSCGTPSCAQEASKPQAFPSVSMASFIRGFDTKLTSMGLTSASLRKCTPGTSGRVCTYSFDSIAFNLLERDETNDLMGVQIIFAKDSVPEDLIIATGTSLYVLAPGLAKSTYGSWIAGATNAIKANVPFDGSVGPVHIEIPRVGGLGLIVYLTPEPSR